MASSRSNGEPACCAFRDAHDETLQAMGEPEYWWTMDSLVEAAAEKGRRALSRTPVKWFSRPVTKNRCKLAR